MKRLIRSSVLALTATSLLAACGGAEEEPAVMADTEVVAEPTAAATAPAATTEGMEGMAGMEGMQQGGTASQLQGHMQMMQGASGEQLKQMLPEHRQLVANTIAQMNREMQGMDMSNNTEWNETVQALRQDLVQLPEMAPQELKDFMPQHQERINKLTEMHRTMMSSM